MVVSDQASDQTALNSYLMPYLKKAGITPQVFTISANLNDSASTNSDAQLAVERLKAAGVQSVIPMLPENAFFPYLASETSQQYYPQLLLSDYQSTITLALGLIPTPYEKALNGQEGVTTETLGGFDDARPESQGGYDPGRALLLRHLAQGLPPGAQGAGERLHRGAGSRGHWCASIRLFAQAATNAGTNLNRRTFVTAMSKIKNFPGAAVADLDLRSHQDVRAHAVPGGEDPQQRAAVVAVQAEDQPQAPGHVLGDRAALQAPAQP